MGRKLHQYESDDIVVTYDLARCIHAARCVQGLPSVFDPDARPWVQPEKASAQEVAAVIEACPTGALQYERRDGGPPEEAPPENRVELRPDGPLFVHGDLRMHDPESGEERVETRVALCRCGRSSNKPFCDNAHVDSFHDAALLNEVKMKTVEEEAEALTIEFAANGPILLRGPAEVCAADGTVAQGGTCALCRCGESSNKPFCDGTHKRVGFAAP